MKSQRAKSVVLGGALLFCAAASSASAADLGPYQPYNPPPPEPNSYEQPSIWEGAYIGINGGYGWSNSNAADPSGGFGGGQLGYNWQRDRFVFGLEGDIQGADIEGRNDFNTAKTDVDWFSTVRGRVGVAQGPFLLYATGGLAIADIYNRATGPGPTTLRDRDTETGYAVGGGLEWAFARNWSAKAEYLYLGFGDKTLSDGVSSASVNNDIQVVRVGLNYKF